MSDYIGRMCLEYHELQIRIEALKKFANTQEHKDLPAREQSELNEQYTHMQRYFDVLQRRLGNAIENA